MTHLSTTLLALADLLQASIKELDAIKKEREKWIRPCAMEFNIGSGWLFIVNHDGTVDSDAIKQLQTAAIALLNERIQIKEQDIQRILSDLQPAKQ